MLLNLHNNCKNACLCDLVNNYSTATKETQLKRDSKIILPSASLPKKQFAAGKWFSKSLIRQHFVKVYFSSPMLIFSFSVFFSLLPVLRYLLPVLPYLLPVLPYLLLVLLCLQVLRHLRVLGHPQSLPLNPLLFPFWL